jgi:hypothetical protein
VESRFSAVTMISSKPVPFSAGVLPAAAADAPPLSAPAQTRAEMIDAPIRSRTSAAHNTLFMSESPFDHARRARDGDNA